MRLPCILLEDADLLVVNKPAGIATHRAGEDAPWGIVEFLESHRPDLAPLGVHQRLDRETSGVMIFARSPEANRSLARQFESRAVRKTYLFLTGHGVSRDPFTAREPIEGRDAVTHFRFHSAGAGGSALWEARPETGRTHQVRLHAAQHGLPIVGDDIEAGGLMEPLLLHAWKLELHHPRDERALRFEASVPEWFGCKSMQERRMRSAVALRRSLLDDAGTNACRLIHRESDGFPGITVDRLGDVLYIEDFRTAEPDLQDVEALLRSAATPVEGMETPLILSRAAPGSRREAKRLLCGEPPAPDFFIRENGIRFHLDPLAPGGNGIFLDQRENRRRVRDLSRGKRVLNLFAYTCGFSVAAAAGGAARTVSVDLSRPALEWGKRNFCLNGLDPSGHGFFADDAAKVLAGLASRGEQFDIVIADPPSFARGKRGGHFSAKKDFGGLAAGVASVLAPGGWFLASTNLAGWKPAEFLKAVEAGIRTAGKTVTEKNWMPQPFDFPVTKSCPAHLKSVWLRM